MAIGLVLVVISRRPVKIRYHPQITFFAFEFILFLLSSKQDGGDWAGFGGFEVSF